MESQEQFHENNLIFHDSLKIYDEIYEKRKYVLITRKAITNYIDVYIIISQYYILLSALILLDENIFNRIIIVSSRNCCQ